MAPVLSAFSPQQSQHSASSNAASVSPISQETLENLPFPIAIFTLDGLCVGANQIMERLSHLPRNKLVGGFNVLTDPAVDERTRSCFRAAAAGETVRLSDPVRYDLSLPGMLNHKRPFYWLESLYVPYRNAAGEVTHVMQIFQDVTDREEALIEARLLKSLVEHASVGIAVTNLEGRITFGNPAFQALTGYDPSTTKVTLLELHASEAASIESIGVAIVQQGQWTGHLRTHRADGSIFPAEVVSFPIRDGSGQLQGFGAILRDLTAEEERRGRLSLFEALIEHATDGIGVANAEGIYIYTNPAYQRMTGYGPAMIGMNAYDLVIPEDRSIAEEATRRLLEQGHARIRIRYRHKDGYAIPLGMSLFTYRTPHGETLFIGFARDISALLRAEEERLKFQEQIIEAQRAALRELSTPLIPIADGVMAMPLIGTIDTGRAQQVIETLLDGVASARAHTAIIDITGVPVVDSQVANALMQAARAVRLLGARVILTGIRPEVAQILVSMGADLSGIITLSTLQSGIAAALGGVQNGRR